MIVTVQYTAQAKLFAGVASEELEIRAGANVEQLIRHIAARDNTALRSFLFGDNGQPRQSYLVCIGDRCVRGNAADSLKDGDHITIMSMISGG